ncbi:MAG: VWA domain-containing protein [Solirubrobacterales bacterium]
MPRRDEPGRRPVGHARPRRPVPARPSGRAGGAERAGAARHRGRPPLAARRRRPRRPAARRARLPAPPAARAPGGGRRRARARGAVDGRAGPGRRAGGRRRRRTGPAARRDRAAPPDVLARRRPGARARPGDGGAAVPERCAGGGAARRPAPAARASARRRRRLRRAARALVGQRPRRPGPRRPGDRTTDLSVRATVRAAARSGRPLAQELRTQARRPTATLDVVLALDVSGSMLGARTRGLAQALAHALARGGHRVALLAFSTTVTVVCPLTRDARRLRSAAAEIEPADPTNLELVVDEARELLLRESRPSRSRRLLLVTDAHPTVCGRPAAGAPAVGRQQFGAIARAAPGAPGQPFGAGVARQAALRAAARCRREGIGVSVLCPAPDRSGAGAPDLVFAARLARAAGGRALPAPGAR